MAQRIETHMAFIPSEVIHGVLFDFLSDDAAEEVAAANIPLGFYSENAYPSDKDAHDLTLRRFKATTEGGHLPLFPDVTGDYHVYRDERSVLRNGLEIKVTVDVSDNEDLTRDAQLLGFADSRKLIVARLAILADQLAPSETHAASIRRLRDAIFFPLLPEDKLAEVTFIDSLLTD